MMADTTNKPFEKPQNPRNLKAGLGEPKNHKKNKTTKKSKGMAGRTKKTIRETNKTKKTKIGELWQSN